MDQDAGAAPRELPDREVGSRSEDRKRGRAGETQLSVTQMEVVTVVDVVAKAK